MKNGLATYLSLRTDSRAANHGNVSVVVTEKTTLVIITPVSSALKKLHMPRFCRLC